MEDDDAYNNSHRAFLQAFMARSSFTLETAKPCLAAIQSAHAGREVLPDDITDADFNSYVSAINAAVSPFDMEIRSAWTQTTGDVRRVRQYALINTTQDSYSQLATTHSADELAYIRRLLDAMFEKNNTLNREVMGVTQIEALRLNRPSPTGRTSGIGVNDNGGAATGGSGGGLTGKEAEKMLNVLVQEDWLTRKGDFYSLSARALMELQSYLLETYNEEEDENGEGARQRIKMCAACKGIVTVGQRCQQKRCSARLHDHCVASFFRAQRAEACPVCREAWTGQDFVGQRALNAGGNRGSGVGARRNTTNMDDSDDAYAMDFLHGEPDDMPLAGDQTIAGAEASDLRTDRITAMTVADSTSLIATMRCQHLQWLAALSFLASASAQAPPTPLATPSDTLVLPEPNHDVQIGLKFLLPNGPTYDLVGLTPNATWLLGVGAGDSFINGTLILHDDRNPQIGDPNSDIPFISCDDVYHGDINLAYLVNSAVRANVSAIVLYSQQGMQCTLAGTLPNGFLYVYSTTSNASASQIVSNIGTGVNTAISSLNTLDHLQVPNNNGSGLGGFGGPSTAVAMIILYSITGVITALFLVIIITGAVRAHRHPERYGPRNVIGRPRQSRAKGIARAMLETLPIVKFGDSGQPPKDVELSESSDASAQRSATASAAETKDATAPGTAETTTSRDATASAVPAATPVPVTADAGADQDNNATCSICTEDFEKGQDIRVLPCDHKFHPACVDPWLLDVSGTCPLCRVDLRPAEAPATTDATPETGDMPPPLDPTADAANINSSGGRLRGLLRRLQPATAEERLAALRRFREENATSERTAGAAATTAEDHAGRWERVRRRVGI
ncbi:hypothetical protein FH972_021769 [Carpinus fangiana]|uniref:Non-structural maintenance of chromosomes element 1 homolog n=1 Tax=Carpinus fangiana TaxID=176857 RepID=A0A5N6KQB5_9ROSI|nr:hypothetical protein FH972_021769 [Carpinus fangiana]